MLDLVAVFAGGVIGTALRLGIDAAIPHSSDEFPVSTLVINILGTAALGFLVARVWPLGIPSWLKLGLGAGVLGTFTTFSAVSLAVVSLTTAGNGMLAVGYLTASLALGFGAAATGLGLGRRKSPA